MQSTRSPSVLYLIAGLAAMPCAAYADLLGLIPQEPTISFGSSGVIAYNADTETITISGDPAALLSGDIFGEILGTGTTNIKYIDIRFQVDHSGYLYPNVADADLEIKGSIDLDWDGIPEYTGTLLTAKVAQFGFLDGISAGDDAFDLRLNELDGALAPLYIGTDLGISITSEVSAEYTRPFSGDFSADWQGQAKGVIGSLDIMANNPGGCHIQLVSKCSVYGGPYRNKCKVRAALSPKHWQPSETIHHGKVFYKSKYGLHGEALPYRTEPSPSTDVTFQYVVTNDGGNPISNIAIDDSFDTPLTGYPTSLAAGNSFTVSRTIALSEAIANDVNVIGEFRLGSCAADDVVIVENKPRVRRDDDFTDSGSRD
jgi:hypothetical protein